MENRPLCVMKQNTMKEYGGMDALLHTLLASALDKGTQINTPGRFTGLERATDTHWLGGWPGLEAELDCTVPAGCRTLNSAVLEPSAVTPPTTEPSWIQVTGVG
jgi:hypothetical protein